MTAGTVARGGGAFPRISFPFIRGSSRRPPHRTCTVRRTSKTELWNGYNRISHSEMLSTRLRASCDRCERNVVGRYVRYPQETPAKEFQANRHVPNPRLESPRSYQRRPQRGRDKITKPSRFQAIDTLPLRFNDNVHKRFTQSHLVIRNTAWVTH